MMSQLSQQSQQQKTNSSNNSRAMEISVGQNQTREIKEMFKNNCKKFSEDMEYS